MTHVQKITAKDLLSSIDIETAFIKASYANIDNYTNKLLAYERQKFKQLKNTSTQFLEYRRDVICNMKPCNRLSEYHDSSKAHSAFYELLKMEYGMIEFDKKNPDNTNYITSKKRSSDSISTESSSSASAAGIKRQKKY